MGRDGREEHSNNEVLREQSAGLLPEKPKADKSFAPAPALLSVPAAAPSNPYGEDIFIAHRYLALGPRGEHSQSGVQPVG